MATDLLPPNATALERCVARAGAARVEAIALPVADLWRPDTIPVDLLPWLAWGLSVDRWDSGWSEAQKRAEIAASIDRHRRKGTRATVEAVIASFDALMYLVEAHEKRPRGTPHTFDLVMPVNAYDGAPPNVATVEAIIREVVKVKPVRSHMTVLQQLETAGRVGIVPVATVAGYQRAEAAAYTDSSPVWDTYLQTEAGEPIEVAPGVYLEDTP